MGEPAPCRPEHLADRFEQVLGHAAAFEDKAHEREERDRQQRVVAHDPEDAFGQGLQQFGLQEAEIDRDDAEKQAVGGEREGNWIAEQQKDDERREHQRRQVGDQHRRHSTAPFRNSSTTGSWCCSRGSGMRPNRKAARLMISDTPCKASSRNPTGIISLIGHRNSPPASAENSWRVYASTTNGQASTMMMTAIG